MQSRRPPSATALLSISDLDRTARSTGFVRRHSRKCSACGFLMALLQSVVQGACSLNQVVQKLGGLEASSMSRQAVHKRFSERSTRFLAAVLGRLLRRRGQRAFAAFGDCAFARVLVEDSTVISMAKSNAGHFPNNGNGRDDTAGCKVAVVTDILRGKVVRSGLHPAREPDQKLAGDILQECRGAIWCCATRATSLSQRCAA